MGKVECDTQQLLLELGARGCAVRCCCHHAPALRGIARSSWALVLRSAERRRVGCSCSSCKTMRSSASDKRRQNGAEVVIVSPPMPLCKVLHIGACGDTMAVYRHFPRAAECLLHSGGFALFGAEYATTRAPGGSVCAGRYEPADSRLRARISRGIIL